MFVGLRDVIVISLSSAHMQQEGPPIVPAPVPAQGTPASANVRGPQILSPHVAGSRWPQVVRDFIWQVQAKSNTRYLWRIFAHVVAILESTGSGSEKRTIQRSPGKRRRCRRHPARNVGC